MENDNFESWAILELMGHRKLAGLVKTESLGGAPFIRIDVYSTTKIELTQYYNPSAIYSILPVSKEIAIRFTEANIHMPVTRWELMDPEINEDML